MADRAQISWANFTIPFGLSPAGLVQTTVTFGAVVVGSSRTKYGAVSDVISVARVTDARATRKGVVVDAIAATITTQGQSPLAPNTAAGGLVYLFGDYQLASPQGHVSVDLGFGATVAGTIQSAPAPARAGIAIFVDRVTQGYVPGAPVPEQLATPKLATAWTSDPLGAPTYVDTSAYLRDLSVKRGRSYEYDRVETGVSEFVLDNRDSRFDPDNASGPYYPNVKPTRRVYISARWNNQDYPLMTAFTEGYPQEFPGNGFDAVVQQAASDWFYPLNQVKFTPATTTLELAIATTPPPDTVEIIRVGTTDLPMPQAFPFKIQIGSGDTLEIMEVISCPRATSWEVKRGQEQSLIVPHEVGDEVRSEAVMFAEELSGTRIAHCLDLLGVATIDRDIDAGNSLIAASENLAGSAILEHCLLIAEVENGLFFASRTGKATFRQRHWQLITEKAPRAVFGPGEGEIDFLSDGNVLAHDDAKIFNRIRITLPTGQIVEASDQASIDAHFERVLDKQWPLASEVEAQDAARYMLERLKEAPLRIPQINLRPRGNDMSTVLAIDLGQRYRLKMDPYVGTTVVDRQVLVERITHQASPGDWKTSLEFSEASVQSYWLLNTNQLGVDTKLAY